MASFDGFPPRTFEWFRGLLDDNSKEYVHKSRATYDADVRGALHAMLEQLQTEFGGRLKLFRQNRDTRFSPDKSPYKTNTYGLLLPESGASGLYAELSVDGLYAGTGYHDFAKDQLPRFREAVAADGPGGKLQALVDELHGAGIETHGEVLKTAPRGYPRDHPRVALLRHKLLIAGRELPAGDGNRITRSAALDHCGSTWRACMPMCVWLDRHVGPSQIPPEVRYGRA